MFNRLKDYVPIPISLVWDTIGDGLDVRVQVKDNRGKFRKGIYDVSEIQINAVLDLIEEDNVIFYVRKQEV